MINKKVISTTENEISINRPILKNKMMGSLNLKIANAINQTLLIQLKNNLKNSLVKAYALIVGQIIEEVEEVIMTEMIAKDIVKGKINQKTRNGETVTTVYPNKVLVIQVEVTINSHKTTAIETTTDNIIIIIIITLIEIIRSLTTIKTTVKTKIIKGVISNIGKETSITTTNITPFTLIMMETEWIVDLITQTKEEGHQLWITNNKMAITMQPMQIIKTITTANIIIWQTMSKQLFLMMIKITSANTTNKVQINNRCSMQIEVITMGGNRQATTMKK
jgi:hypothetical protein